MVPRLWIVFRLGGVYDFGGQGIHDEGHHMNEKRFAAMYAFPFGFLVVRALIDGETLLERAALIAVVAIVAIAMYPLCKRLSGRLSEWFSKYRKNCPECDCNMSVRYKVCPNCKILL